jgi:mitochondrial pyruvate carrier 1
MTGAMVVYAATFMRYSLAVTPKNYLLFLCHLTNFGAQTTQGYRYLNFHYWGGKTTTAAEGKAPAPVRQVAAVKR